MLMRMCDGSFHCLWVCVSAFSMVAQYRLFNTNYSRVLCKCTELNNYLILNNAWVTTSTVHFLIQKKLLTWQISKYRSDVWGKESKTQWTLAWLRSHYLYHTLAQILAFLEIHSNEILKVLLNFIQVQILHAQVWLQAMGKQITTINYVFPQPRMFVGDEEKSFSALDWPEIHCKLQTLTHLSGLHSSNPYPCSPLFNFSFWKVQTLYSLF